MSAGPIAVFRRELGSYFFAPIAYVVGVVFLTAQGFSFWAILRALSDPQEPAEPGAVLRSFFGGHILHWMLCFAVVAVLSMKAIAEDRQRGMWEAALTTRVSSASLLLGKWLAAAVFYTVLWAPTLLFLPVFLRYTPPGVTLDMGPVVAAYLGSSAIGALLLACGVLAASCTKNPVIAVVTAFSSCLLWFFIGEIDSLSPTLASGASAAVLEFVDLRSRLQALASGAVELDLFALCTGGTLLALLTSHLILGLSRVSRRRLRHRALRLVAAAVATVSVCTLAQRHLPVIDVTEGRIHTLEPQTVALLRSIDEPIEVSLVRPADAEFDAVYAHVGELLRRMRREQSLLRLREIDGLDEPERLRELAREAGLHPRDLASGGALILRRGKSLRSVDLFDLATFESDALGVGALAELRAEASIGAGIRELLVHPVSRLCVSQGRGELPLDPELDDNWAAVQERLSQESIETVVRTALDDDVEECDALVVLGPQTALRAEEVFAVERYLEAGGRLLLAPRALGTAAAAPATGLELVLEERGIGITSAFAMSVEELLPEQPAWMTFEGYTDHPIVAGFDGRVATLWEAPRHLLVEGGAEAVVVARNATLYYSSGDERAQPADSTASDAAVVAAVTGARGERIVVLGSATSLSSRWFRRGYGGNERLFASAILWLLERRVAPERFSKSPEHIRLLMTDGALQGAFIWCVVLLPLLFCALGGLLYWLRRREGP